MAKGVGVLRGPSRVCQVFVLLPILSLPLLGQRALQAVETATTQHLLPNSTVLRLLWASMKQMTFQCATQRNDAVPIVEQSAIPI
jgi:hypothetical protein